MEFAAKVHKLGSSPCVNVPERIVNALLSDAKKQSGPVQVKGTLNGHGRNPNQQRIFDGQSPPGSDVQEDRKQAD